MTDLPQNNADILANPEAAKDRFYLLAEFNKASDGTHILVKANEKCVAQHEKDADATGTIFRKHWDKPDSRAQYSYPDDMRLIGAGGIVSVKIGDEEPKTILFEKTGGPSKGRMAQATGLSDEHPFHTMWTEIAEETGILIVDRDSQLLTLVVIEPDFSTLSPFDLDQHCDFIEDMKTAKEAQLENIREQLPEDLKDWPIELEPMTVYRSPEDVEYLEMTSIRIQAENGDEEHEAAEVIVSDSEKTANVNLMMPVRLNLPAGTEVICVDPEEFQRPVQLVTRSEMLTDDFITHKSSVPMRPYLEEVQRAELSNG